MQSPYRRLARSQFTPLVSPPSAPCRPGLKGARNRHADGHGPSDSGGTGTRGPDDGAAHNHAKTISWSTAERYRSTVSARGMRPIRSCVRACHGEREGRGDRRLGMSANSVLSCCLPRIPLFDATVVAHNGSFEGIRSRREEACGDTRC